MFEPTSPRMPKSPNARKDYPPEPNHMFFNFFSPDDFSFEKIYPTDAIIKKKDSENTGYKGQTTSLRTKGSFASRPKPSDDAGATTARFQTSARYVRKKKKGKTRQRVAVVESDIYAISSEDDED
jgi:hypothetical protein